VLVHIRADDAPVHPARSPPPPPLLQQAHQVRLTRSSVAAAVADGDAAYLSRAASVASITAGATGGAAPMPTSSTLPRPIPGSHARKQLSEGTAHGYTARRGDPASVESRHAAALTTSPRVFHHHRGAFAEYLETAVKHRRLVPQHTAHQRLSALQTTLQLAAASAHLPGHSTRFSAGRGAGLPDVGHAPWPESDVSSSDGASPPARPTAYGTVRLDGITTATGDGESVFLPLPPLPGIMKPRVHTQFAPSSGHVSLGGRGGPRHRRPLSASRSTPAFAGTATAGSGGWNWGGDFGSDGVNERDGVVPVYGMEAGADFSDPYLDGRPRAEMEAAPGVPGSGGPAVPLGRLLGNDLNARSLETAATAVAHLVPWGQSPLSHAGTVSPTVGLVAADGDAGSVTPVGWLDVEVDRGSIAASQATIGTPARPHTPGRRPLSGVTTSSARPSTARSASTAALLAGASALHPLAQAAIAQVRVDEGCLCVCPSSPLLADHGRAIRSSVPRSRGASKQWRAPHWSHVHPQLAGGAVRRVRTPSYVTVPRPLRLTDSPSVRTSVLPPTSPWIAGGDSTPPLPRGARFLPV